jgi:multidrug transporter EmrE-like cation transporter
MKPNIKAGNKFMLYALLLIAVLLEVTGDLLFRKWGIDNRWPVFVLAIVVYNIGAVAWGYSLQFMQVSTGIIVLGVLNVVLVVIGGVVFFREQLSTLQVIGVVLGLASLILLSGER